MGQRLQHLFDRNVQWVDRKTRSDPSFFVRMAEQQSPNYLWLGCSDSRVTANDVLGLDPGEVFVHRNIANIVHTSDMNFLAVLEFAVQTLGVKDIVVCGHYGCGGVWRALATERSALVDHWLQPLVMLFRKHAADFRAMPDDQFRCDRLVEINVEMQVRRIAATPIVEAAWARGQELVIHGWIYGLADGLIRDLGVSLSSASERDALPPIDQRVREPLRPRSTVELQIADSFAPLTPCC